MDNLPDGYQEIVDFGMLAYVIPLETYPKTYNGRFIRQDDPPTLYIFVTRIFRNFILFFLSLS